MCSLFKDDDQGTIDGNKNIMSWFDMGAGQMKTLTPVYAK